MLVGHGVSSLDDNLSDVFQRGEAVAAPQQIVVGLASTLREVISWVLVEAAKVGSRQR